MNHYLFIKLPFGKKSIAFCSYQKPKKLIIFVHGFNGSSLNTWNEFPKMIQEDDSFSEIDVIFYGYDSLRSQANNISISLFKLINSAVNIAKMPYPNRELPEGYTYESIFLAAHSLGGVISRLALLYAFDNKMSWVDRCKLVLYAPAHFGSRVPENFKDCFIGSTIFLRAFAYTKYPILIDLKEGSQLLTDLLKKCTTTLLSGYGNFLKAVRVIWAEYERVVISKRFLEDTIEQQIDNTTHISVCKISANFHEPLDHLTQVL